MAIEKIKYKNKVAIKNDESLPEINKVTDENMNEIDLSTAEKMYDYLVQDIESEEE